MSISKETFLNALAVYKALQDENYNEVFAAGASGIVPAPTTNDAAKFLRGDGSWATPTVIIGTTSSTVDGGLWYEFDSGLPVVKMNYKGEDFLIDTRPAPAADMLIGDVLYLGGHRFKLTGFADGLTFSENNFYAGGNSTPIGSVSNYQFQFGSESALNVADGGTISIVQLDNDTVDYTLNLDALNTSDTYRPWKVAGSTTVGTNTYTADATKGEYLYVADGSSIKYIKTGSTSYTLPSNTSSAGQTVLQLKLCNSTFLPKQIMFGATAAEFSKTVPVEVEEIRNTDGTMKEFVVKILGDAAIKNDNVYMDSITATADVPVEFQFANDMKIGILEKETDKHVEGSLKRDEQTGNYTFKTDKYTDGYYSTTSTATNDSTTTYTTTVQRVDLSNVTTKYFGDECTITGLADGLSVVRNSDYNYTIYKGKTDTDTGTEVGTIVKGVITITDIGAFDISATELAGLGTGTFTAKVIDTQDEITNNTTDNFIRYTLNVTAKEDDVAEGFTYNSETGTYTYRTGKVGWHFDVKTVYGGGYTSTTTATYVPDYVPEKMLAPEGLGLLVLQITGLPNFGDLDIYWSEGVAQCSIYNQNNKFFGSIDPNTREIRLSIDTSSLPLAENFSVGDSLAITGFNDYTFKSIELHSNGYNYSYGTYRNTYMPVYRTADQVNIHFSANTYFRGFGISNDGKTATYYQGSSYKDLRYLTSPNGCHAFDEREGNGNEATELWWKPTITGTAYAALTDEEKANYRRRDDVTYILTDETTYIKFCEFDGQNFILNSHAFDGMTTADTINITDYIGSTPLNFDIELATDADTLAISRTFANETFTVGATAGTYTYTATGSTAGWNISADGTQIASWEFNGKTFTIENLRTDLGNLSFDSQGYIHATNGSTIGRMGGNVIKLYDTAVHKLATPTLTGADAADFTLTMPT